MKVKYNIIFVVLTYRNTADLEFFLKNNTIDNSKIIVVNSYYDEDSLSKFQALATSYGCDFLPVENKGYSYGNNLGIKYAVEKYDFEYLIVSNADIEIIKLDIDFLKRNENKAAVYAPRINTLTGKDQNPFILRYNKIMRTVFYYACLRSNRILKHIIYGLNKIDRVLFLKFASLSSKDLFKVYSCHGSFIIINKRVLEKEFKLFNDDMFLFQEEHFFARQCKLNNVPIYFVNNKIKIKHFEDGSASSIKDKIIKYSEESYIAYHQYFND